MRRALAAAAALITLAGNALAQDKPLHSGAYVGMIAGYSTASLQAPGIDFAAAGAQGGLVAGWGIVGQSGLYLGLEADAVLKDIKWQVGDVTGQVTASNQWVGTMRGRVGQAFGPMLLYVTGGAAVTEAKISATGLGSDSEMRWGWVGGGGIDAHITRTVSIRFEGLHYQFPDKAFWLSGDTAKVGVGETVARVGITFKLQ